MEELPKPVNKAGIWRSRGDEGGDRDNQRGDGRRALGEASRVQDHNAVMLTSLGAVLTIQSEEVVAVTGDERALITLGVSEQVRIKQAAQGRILVDGRDIAIAGTQLLGDAGREHLVKQEPHASARCSRRHCSSAASASSTLRAIRSSISWGYSAR